MEIVSVFRWVFMYMDRSLSDCLLNDQTLLYLFRFNIICHYFCCCALDTSYCVLQSMHIDRNRWLVSNANEVFVFFSRCLSYLFFPPVKRRSPNSIPNRFLKCRRHRASTKSEAFTTLFVQMLIVSFRNVKLTYFWRPSSLYANFC